MSETLRREVLQSSVTVDWAAKTAAAPPLWVGYALQFMSTLLPTLLFEGLILLLFRYEWRKNWKVFLAVNLVTQTALSVFLSVTSLRNGVNAMFLLLFIPAEVVIAGVEAGVYSRFLQGYSRKRAVLYGLTANAVSAVIGWDILEPVWKWIVRIS